MEATIRNLKELVESGAFKEVTLDSVKCIEDASRLSIILEAISLESGFIHGDLGGDNVLRCGDGYRVIDWQRPIRGPKEYNLHNLVSDCGYDSSKYVHPGIPALGILLGVRWFTECKNTWFPNGQSYDGHIARAAAELESVCK